MTNRIMIHARGLPLVATVTLILLGNPAALCHAQQPGAVTVQLPQFGIAVDADGVLSVAAYADPDGRLWARRKAAAAAGLAADLRTAVPLRKISLVRLERAIRTLLAEGKEPDDVMRHLAGLTRVQYVFCYPDRHDLVVAGPAEGWVADLAGRAVGLESGRPVLLLEDLATALRTCGPARPAGLLVGCSIDPPPEGLARLGQLQRSIPRTISTGQRQQVAARLAEQLVRALGKAEIRVFGVSARTHMARVLVEADYRMKRIGIGLEPPPVTMTTFIGALRGARHHTLQRWWFVPDYHCVRLTPDHLAMELVSDGVELLGEDRLVQIEGTLGSPAPPSRASQLFTLAFTRKYREIAAASPVYAQLRNMIDLLIVAAFVRREDLYGRIGWDGGCLHDEARLPVETLTNPRRVDAVVNVVWKGNRLLAPAGGGVAIRPDEALRGDRIKSDEHAELAGKYHQLKGTPPIQRWWWD